MKQLSQCQWRIRRATRSDSAAIKHFLGTQHRLRRSGLVVSEYFIAESFGEIVGCVAARKQKRRGYLYGLSVEKSRRRRGIGHALTQHGLDWLRDEGVEAVFTLVMFWNIRFVKQHGFDLVDKRVKTELTNLHPDFGDKWTVRSTLMIANQSQVSRF